MQAPSKTKPAGSLWRRVLFGRPALETPGDVLGALEAGWSLDAFLALQRLAQGGDFSCQLRLAGMYEHGEGITANLVDAVHWYTQAAEGGNVEAQARLGLIFFQTREDSDAPDTPPPLTDRDDKSGLLGHSLPLARDLHKAAHWNRLAADAGNAPSCVRIGQQLAMGLGVGQDLGRAEHYFQIAGAEDLASA